MRLTLPELHLPPIHSQDRAPEEELLAYGKFVCVEARLTWFLLEIAQDQDTFCAYLIDSRSEQFGYFSFTYLERTLPAAATFTYEELTPIRLREAVAEERTRRFLAYGEQRVKGEALAPHRAYYLAAEYPPAVAKEVTNAVRRILSHQKVNLSAFCLLPGVQAQVVIIGDRPAEALHDRIMEALRGQALITIDYDLLMGLFRRKMEENRQGEWREHHARVKLRRKKKSKRPRR